jgi:hypothetical protein
MGTFVTKMCAIFIYMCAIFEKEYKKKKKKFRLLGQSKQEGFALKQNEETKKINLPVRNQTQICS